MSEKDNIKIRMAKQEDARRILDIYSFYVINTPYSFECEPPSLELFTARLNNFLKTYPYLVAETAGKIIGYAYASPFKERAAYNWTVETTVYLDRGRNGKGTAQRLYLALEEILKKQNFTNMNACIANVNIPSIRFHEKMGYKKVAHFTKCGYKLGQWQDMIWMEKSIAEYGDRPKEIIPITEMMKQCQPIFEG